MYAGQWVFRDANWSPDFPTSAKQLQALYELDTGVATDGVIAINQKVLPGVLDSLGPIMPEGYSERVTAANAIAKIEEYWATPRPEELPADWWSHRKDMLGALLRATLPRLLSAEVDKAKLARALIDSLRAKDILIYINDAATVTSPSLLSTGFLYQGKEDALTIVDSNLGYNKVNGNIDERADYAVHIDGSGEMTATLAITYTNLSPATGAYCVHQPLYQGSYANLAQGCYWDYVRVYVPAGAQFVGAAGLVDVTKGVESGRAVFGGFLLLDRGDRKVVRFTYRLPMALGHGDKYALHLEKQSGAAVIAFTTRVSFPDAWSIRSTSPSANYLAGSRIEFARSLECDQVIAAQFAVPPAK
jgi:hypothetical protein